MIKLTNSVLIGLISASLLVGCGSSDNDNDDAGGSTDTPVETPQPVEPNDGTGGDMPATPPPAMPTASTFGANVMPILVASCQSCHGTSGDFTVTTASATWDNIQQNGGPQYVHDMGNGQNGHPVGDKLSDADSATFQAWINAGAMNN